ncbi:MAG: DUF3488 domain-containing protein [Acidobacteria bacterium]|nr:DUF3488 domain-containing protein [Acidobacteriota bacterium]
MTFSRCFKLSSYGLAGSGFGALASTGALHPAAVALFSAVFALSWFVDPGAVRRSLPPWIAGSLLPLCIAFAAIDGAWLSRSWPAALVHLLPLVTAVRLLVRTRGGDHGVLALLGLGQLLAAATLTGNLTFLFWFLLFLPSATAFLILLEMHRGHRRSLRRTPVSPAVPAPALQRPEPDIVVPFPAGAFAAALIGIALLVLAGAVPLFFLLPRVTLGLYRQPAGPTRFVTGFSDRVQLGRDGRLEPSDTLVMRVRTDPPDGDPRRELRWRGLAFDHFDGWAWTRSDTAARPVPVQGRFYKLEETAQGTRWIEQTYFLESLDTPVVFLLGRALAIGREAGALGRDAAGNLYAHRPRGSRLSYTVLSDAVEPDPAVISDLFPVPEEIRRKYLQLPELDPAIARRAREVTRAASGRYARARALEEHLRRRYTYSLELDGLAGPDPLAAFLFQVGAGHCEYFASALAVMMRQEGIPSRLVNGYRAGDYNPFGGNWTVRQRHAHSWVEAWFPPYGWIEFDPTPSPPPPARHAFMRALTDFGDAVGLWWWAGVVHYDSSRQHRAAGRVSIWMTDLGGRAAAAGRLVRDRWPGPLLSRSPGRPPRIPWRWALWLALPLLLAAPPVRDALLRARARLRRRKLPRATAVYLEALDLLSARGFGRRRGQTPMEFARSIGPHPAAAPLVDLTRLYYAARFGNPAPPEPGPDLAPPLRSLRSALKKNRESPE